jgi:hypothetical protein
MTPKVERATVPDEPQLAIGPSYCKKGARDSLALSTGSAEIPRLTQLCIRGLLMTVMEMAGGSEAASGRRTTDSNRARSVSGSITNFSKGEASLSREDSATVSTTGGLKRRGEDATAAGGRTILSPDGRGREGKSETSETGKKSIRYPEKVWTKSAKGPAYERNGRSKRI